MIDLSKDSILTRKRKIGEDDDKGFDNKVIIQEPTTEDNHGGSNTLPQEQQQPAEDNETESSDTQENESQFKWLKCPRTGRQLVRSKEEEKMFWDHTLYEIRNDLSNRYSSTNHLIK